MIKSCKIRGSMWLAISLLFFTACGQTNEDIHFAEEESAEKEPDESIADMAAGVTVEESETGSSLYESDEQDAVEEDAAEEDDHQESDQAYSDEAESVNEETDSNPYRNLSETFAGPWMEALYETHRDAAAIETGEITYVFDLDREHSDYNTYYNTYRVTLPYFLAAGEDQALQKIQQYYAEQKWILTQEEKEFYEAWHEENYPMISSQKYGLWNVYRQEKFITVIFEDYHHGGRGFSDPYADVFWADTGERVTFDELFGGKKEEVEQILTEHGRYIPLGCVMEEWDSWPLMSERHSYVPLPEEVDRCFYPTPYGLVFSYPTFELGSRAEGTVLVFVDWESLEEL